MEYSPTGNSNHNKIVPQTMYLGSQRQVPHANYNNHREGRDPPIYRQGQYNTFRDRQVYLDQKAQQSHSHLQSTHRKKHIHRYPTNTGDQPYLTQNLVHNTRQHCQASTQNLFQNHIVSQQQSHNNAQAPNPFTIAITSYAKSNRYPLPIHTEL